MMPWTLATEKRGGKEAYDMTQSQYATLLQNTLYIPGDGDDEDENILLPSSVRYGW